MKQKIKKLLANLYILTAEEIQAITSKLDNLPEKGLIEIMKVLEDAKKKQEDMLIKLNKANPDFNKELSKFLKTEFSQITKEVESHEQENADKILEGISD